MNHHGISSSASQIRNPENHSPDAPFSASIHSLLELAAIETGATGYVLYEFIEARGSFIPRASRGLPHRRPGPYPVTVASTPLRILGEGPDKGPAILSLPLRGRVGLAGVLDFGFSEPHALTPQQLGVVHRTAEAIERLLDASESNPVLGQLVNRIAQLERVIAEQLISERARGLTENPGGASGRAEALHGHIERVLGPSPTMLSLTDRLNELESKLRARRVLSEAKRALQKQLGITEEQAYLTLRSRSRQTRTPMLDVARQVVDGTGLDSLQGSSRST